MKEIDKNIKLKFNDIGFGKRIDDIYSNFNKSIDNINKNKSISFQENVVNILNDMLIPQDDKLLVVSRDDINYSFWTQKNSDLYMNKLLSTYNKYGHVNQVRIKIYDSSLSEDGLINDKGFTEKIKSIHSCNTYFSMASSNKALESCKNICNLKYGFTISTKYKFAIIPSPSIDIIDYEYNNCIKLGIDIKNIVENGDYYYPSKTFIIGNEKYIDILTDEFNQLVSYIKNNVNSDHSVNILK